MTNVGLRRVWCYCGVMFTVQCMIGLRKKNKIRNKTKQAKAKEKKKERKRKRKKKKKKKWKSIQNS